MPDFPVDVLPDAARQLVEHAKAEGLPSALASGAAIAALAIAVGGRSVADRIGGQRANLWIALIGATGAGKSPVIDLAFGPLRELDRDRRPDPDAGEPDRRMIVGDSTLEALARTLEARGGHLGVVTDELAQLLRGMGEYKRGGGSDQARYLSLWAGQPITVQRVGSGGSRNSVDLAIERPTVSIVGGLQPHLAHLLGDDESGMRVRWLPFLAEESAGVGDARTPLAWIELLGRLVDRREHERTWRLDAKGAAVLTESAAAWKQCARGPVSATESGALLKADVHALRIALLLAEAEHPGVGGDLPVDAIVRASFIIDYSIEVWRAIPNAPGLGLSLRDTKVVQGVEKLRGWLESRTGREASRRDIMRAHAAGIRTPAEADEIIRAYGETYAGSVRSATRGGQPTIIVSAPPRTGVAKNVATPVQKGIWHAKSPINMGMSVTSGVGDTSVATPPGDTFDRAA